MDLNPVFQGVSTSTIPIRDMVRGCGIDPAHKEFVKTIVGRFQLYCDMGFVDNDVRNKCIENIIPDLKDPSELDSFLFAVSYKFRRKILRQSPATSVFSWETPLYYQPNDDPMKVIPCPVLTTRDLDLSLLGMSAAVEASPAYRLRRNLGQFRLLFALSAERPEIEYLERVSRLVLTAYREEVMDNMRWYCGYPSKTAPYTTGLLTSPWLDPDQRDYVMRQYRASASRIYHAQEAPVASIFSSSILLRWLKKFPQRLRRHHFRAFFVDDSSKLLATLPLCSASPVYKWVRQALEIQPIYEKAKTNPPMSLLELPTLLSRNSV